MKLYMQQLLNNCAPHLEFTSILISQLGRNMKNQDYFTVNIKTQPGDVKKTVLLYVPIFKIGSKEELLKFLVIPKKILKGHNLTMGPKCYVMHKKLLSGESLQVFEYKEQENRKTKPWLTTNYSCRV